jgi:hypothetical protein
VSDTPALRASDADRERAIVLLREHAVAGRLTLEEFTDRMSAASRAVTKGELDELTRDLPAAAVPVATSRRGPTRFVVALFGSSEREGRLRVRGRVACLAAFGSVDLDLRRATLEGEAITIVAIAAFGAADVYLPEGIEVDLHGFSLFGHKGLRGNDPPPLPGTPLVRVWALSFCAGIDVWRVPIAWTEKTWREVIRGIRSGAHEELEA